MAVKQELQALVLAEAREEIPAYKVQNHRSIQGRGQPKMMKPSSPRFIKAPIGLDYFPNEFQERRGRNPRFNHHNDDGDYALRWVALDWNNSASSQQVEGRDGMSHGDKVLTSLGTIKRTVNWTLFPLPWCLHLRPVPTRDTETRSRMEPLIAT